MEKEQSPNKKIAESYGDKIEQEQDFELGRVAKNVIDCYDFNPKKESFLVITDTKVMEANPEFIIAVERNLKERTNKDQRTKGNYEIIIIPASPYSATSLGEFVGDKMKNRPVLITTSMSRSHSLETGVAYRGEIPKKGNFDEIIKSEKFNKFVDESKSTVTSERLEELREQAEIPQEKIDEDNYYSKLQEIAKKTRSRIISITKGCNPYEILTKGAVEEPVEKLRERADKINRLMKNVEQVHIKTNIGTDLVLKPRIDKSIFEDGKLNKPGDVSNYPIGEWCCAPQLDGANGTLMVDIAAGGNHNKDQFDEFGPIELEIKNGIVISINKYNLSEFKDFLSNNTNYDLLEKDDSNNAELKNKKEEEKNRIQKLTGKFFNERNIENPLVRSMLKYWIAGDNRYHHCFRLAEFAVGTNSMACKNKTPENIGSSEGEKMFGTTHIAVGANRTFGIKKDDPDYNNSAIHCDMVIGNPTIECIQKDNSKFNLIKKGEPIGY